MYWINAICSKTAITPKTTREPVLIHFIDQFSSSWEGVTVVSGSVFILSCDILRQRNKLCAALESDTL